MTKTLDTDEGQREFATRMEALMREFGADVGVYFAADRMGQPLAFGITGTTAEAGRELLRRAISISYSCDEVEPIERRIIVTN